MMKYQEELDLAVEAARAAGTLLRDAFHHEKPVLSNEGRDIKLQADRDAENLILKKLAEIPHDILAEESGEHGEPNDENLFWVVDPLDGTMNFSRGIPLCCVAIALTRGDKPVLGVIYDFMAEECFTGIVGEGAWLNGTPMKVSRITEASHGILCSGFPINFVYDEANLHAYVARLRRFRKVRLLGTAALSLAYVACGRADAYVEDDIMLWDIAAGVALVQAAGGYVLVEDSPTVKWARRVYGASNGSVWKP
jgi:myo-inositol-1(or 4)-monophosphatase